MRKPAVISSYDAATRTCRVSIPGITDQAEVLPEAHIEYAVGDKSALTEVRIKAGDLVWVDFIDDDPRYPIITGYRNPRTGNVTEVRRIQQQGIELTADGTLKLTADKIELVGTTRIKGDVAISGGDLTHENINVSSTHTHSGVQTGSGLTGIPQ
jgi:phage baseplate assembly protein gpV